MGVRAGRRSVALRGAAAAVPAVSAMLAMLVIGLAGCDASGQAQPAGRARPAAVSGPVRGGDVRATVQRHLLQAGLREKAALAADVNATSVSEVPMPVPGRRVLLFTTVPHPGASFHVAVGPDTLVYLTGNPQGFAAVLKNAGFVSRSPAEAVAVARAYVEATRPMTELIRVVGDVGDITWMPRPTAQERRARDRISRSLRSVLRAPRATTRGDTYVATLYVQHGDTVERRAVTLGKGGTVSERTEKVAEKLPIPYVL